MTAPLEWIDTHCHFDVSAFDADREALILAARDIGLKNAVLCAGALEQFPAVRETAHRFNLSFMLGIHPLYLPDVAAYEDTLFALESAIDNALGDPHFVGVGEIGLDGMIEDRNKEMESELFIAQLKLAKERELPVSVHSRHAVEAVTHALKRFGPTLGVVHAFNGSSVQAKNLTQLGYKLGFGGAITYSGSKRIRRILSEISDSDFVLETDAPDMPGAQRREAGETRTEPADIALYAQEAAQIRSTTIEHIALCAKSNALAAFSRLRG